MIERRTFIASLMAVAAVPAHALSQTEAERLIQQVVSDIMRIINSGRSEGAMLNDFQGIFRRYADVTAVAYTVLGPARRQASQAQLNAFVDAFAGYLSRKYGRRFREFIGGQIAVQGARNTGKYYEVLTRVNLRGQRPFDVVFRVSDRSGRNLFFDIVIEGISLGKTERTEIGVLLDRNRGDINAMIAQLRRLG